MTVQWFNTLQLKLIAIKRLTSKRLLKVHSTYRYLEKVQKLNKTIWHILVKQHLFSKSYLPWLLLSWLVCTLRLSQDLLIIPVDVHPGLVPYSTFSEQESLWIRLRLSRGHVNAEFDLTTSINLQSSVRNKVLCHFNVYKYDIHSISCSQWHQETMDSLLFSRCINRLDKLFPNTWTILFTLTHLR